MKSRNRKSLFSGLIQAFEGLISLIIAEVDDKSKEIKNSFFKLIGDKLYCLLKLFPKLAVMLGNEIPAEELTYNDQLNQFNNIFEAFIKVLSNEEHPLVIFFDDLQNIDLSTLNLLENLLTEADLKYFFVISCCRDSEISDFTALNDFFYRIEKNVKIYSDIKLKPLNQESVNDIIVDSLKCNPESANELSKYVTAKTGGNPFYIINYLKTLYDRKLIDFDYDKLEWIWDIENINKQFVCDNVAEMLIENINMTDKKTIELLKTASCIGITFDLKSLCIINNKSYKENAVDLWTAIQSGYIMPLDEEYKFFDTSGSKVIDSFILETGSFSLNLFDMDIVYEFSHENIRTIFYQMIDEETKVKLHYNIGWMFMTYYSKENELNKKIFDIVYHFNKSNSLIKTDAEKYNLIDFNLMAGIKSRKLAAFEVALNYFKKCYELLPSDSFENRYDLTKSVYIELADMELIAGENDCYEELLDKILHYAKDKGDEAGIFAKKILYYENISQYSKCIDAVLIFLKENSITIPDFFVEREILQELSNINNYFNNTYNVYNLKATDDKKISDIYRIVSIVLTALEAGNNRNRLLYILTMSVNLIIKYGYTHHALTIFMFYQSIIPFININELKQSCLISKMILDMADKSGTKFERGYAVFLYGSRVIQFIEPIKNGIDFFNKAMVYSLDAGNYRIYSYCVSFICLYSFFSGMNLEEIEKLVAESSDKLEKLQQKDTESFFYPLKSLLYKLTKAEFSAETNSLEMIRIKQFGSNKFYSAVVVNDIFKLISNFIFNNYDECLSIVSEIRSYTDSILGEYFYYEFVFYETLTLLKTYRSLSYYDKEKVRAKIEANKNIYKIISDENNVNFSGKYKLMLAEGERVERNYEKSIKLYDEAIQIASDNDQYSIEALCNELASYACSERGLEKIAGVYMKEAEYCYKRWGAVNKVEQLRKVNGRL